MFNTIVGRRYRDDVIDAEFYREGEQDRARALRRRLQQQAETASAELETFKLQIAQRLWT